MASSPSSSFSSSSSSSSTGFNDIEFKEYNPHPYCGGYNQSLTYGKPLPPSHATCYPFPIPSLNNPSSLDNPFSYGSETSTAYRQKPPFLDHVKPNHDENSKFYDGYGNWTENHVNGLFSHDHDHDHGHDHENGYCHDQGFTQPMDPYKGEGCGRTEELDGYWAYGETMHAYNPHTSISYLDPYGTWPFSLPDEAYGNSYERHDGDEASQLNPWEATAEYLFGNSETHSNEQYYSFWQGEESEAWVHQSSHYRYGSNHAQLYTQSK